MAALFSNDPGVLATGSFTLRGANVNQTTTDLPTITVLYPTGFTRFRVTGVFVSHASVSLTTATLGVFTAAGGTGTTIVTDAALSGITTASENTAANSISMTLASQTTTSYNLSGLIPRVGTAQGTAATADITITVQFLP
jgi:hypothetical protein